MNERPQGSPPAGNPWCPAESTGGPAGDTHTGHTHPGSHGTEDPGIAGGGAPDDRAPDDRAPDDLVWAPPPPWTPATGPERRAERPVAVVAAVAVLAGLVGGGVGAAVAYGLADDGQVVSSLAAPPANAAPAGPAAPGSVQDVAARVLPSVVSIEFRGGSGSGAIPGSGAVPGSPGPGPGTTLGSGSGVVLSSDGMILTNNHVVANGKLTVTFNDGRSVPAEVVGTDPSSDLAVIKAKGIRDAQPVKLGSSDALQVGQQVVAVGSPLGLAGTVTSGIVSALQRPVSAAGEGGGGGGGGGQSVVIDAIQTDAPINPGNSGGALVNMDGELVGITSAIAALGQSLGGQSGSIGLGFAIPIDQARVIADQLAAGQKVDHPLLGVRVQDSRQPTQRGARIAEVVAGSPAEDAGLRQDDLITRLGDRTIDTADALVAAVRSRRPDETVTLTYRRGGETRMTDVTLGSDN